MLRKNRKRGVPKSGLAKRLKLAAGTGLDSNDPNNQNVYIFTTRRWNGTTYTGERNPNGIVGAIANVQLPAEKKFGAHLESIVAEDPAPPPNPLPPNPVPTPPLPIPAPLPGSGDGSVVKLTASELDKDYLVQEIIAAAAKTKTGEVLFFVHGYNNRFEVSVATAARIARKLGCVVVLIAWNSQGHLIPYSADEASVLWSSAAVGKAGILEALIAAKLKLSFMTHSMGVRLGIWLLLADENTLTVPERVFDKLLLCSPDEDRDFCVIVGSTLAKCAKQGQTYLFVSSHDEALPKSQELHGAPRWGEIGSGELPPDTPGVEVVNDTVMDPSPGHTICLDAVNTFATGAPLPAGYSKELVRQGDSEYWIISQDTTV
jgi:esterase/lipase superfamily enzyme